MADAVLDDLPKVDDPPKGKWFDKYGLSDEDQAVVGRYNTDSEAITGLIEQRHQISKSISVPDSNADDYADQVRKQRLKLGAKEKPADYLIEVPDDLKEAVDKSGYVKDAQEKAVLYGLTQKEIQDAANMQFDKFRQELKESSELETTQKGEVAERKRVMNEELDGLYGPRKEQNMANAAIMTKYWDDGLFSAENAELPEAVVAEKGGILTQMLRASDDPMMWRLFAHLHTKHLGEGGGPPAGGSSDRVDTLFEKAYEDAKIASPNRGHEYWDEIAKGKLGRG